MEKFVEVIPKDHVICRKGDLSFNFCKILKGRLMICNRSDTMVTPIAFLEAGEFFGEMSLFDKKARSADVIAIEETTLQNIPEAELKKQFPLWLILTTKSLNTKLRNLNEIIAKKGIKKRSAQTIEALSIEEQRHYYKILNT